VVPLRSIVRPVLESIVLPELSMMRVLEVFAELLPDTVERLSNDELLPVTVLRVPLVAVLPLVVLLPESEAVFAVLFAELVRYTPELLPERFLVKLL